MRVDFDRTYLPAHQPPAVVGIMAIHQHAEQAMKPKATTTSFDDPDTISLLKATGGLEPRELLELMYGVAAEMAAGAFPPLRSTWHARASAGGLGSIPSG